MTDKSEQITCEALIDGELQLDDPALRIAQQTEVSLPAGEGQAPLLVQLPQDKYLFLAHAQDRFGFLVARGCAADAISAQRVLDLRLELSAIPAPRGRLEAAGPTSWLQPTGSPGLEGAPALEVIALDERGQPQPDVEVRVLVEAGSALPLEEVFHTSGPEGRGGTVCLVGEGPTRVLAHARGLEGSPIAFELLGLPSPDYAVFDIAEPDFEPVDLFCGDVYADDLDAPDLGIVLASPDSGWGHARYWAGAREGASGWEVETPNLLNWHDGTEWARPTHAAAGHFDDDCVDATGPCEQWEDLVLIGVDPVDGTPGMYIQHHNTFAGDRLRSAIPQELPPGIASVERLLTLHVNHDQLDDVVLVVSSEDASASARHAILVFTTQHQASDVNRGNLIFRQRIDIPDPLDEHRPERVGAADVDGDGDDELLLAFDFSGLFIVPCFGELGDDATPYAPASEGSNDWTQLPSYWGENLVAAADVDEDGRLDLMVVNTPESMLNELTARVAYGTGSLEACPVSAPDCGELYFDQPRVLDRAAAGSIDRILLADLNGDGHVDLLTAGAERAALMVGDGQGSFSSPLIIPLNLQRLIAVAATPLDLDAAADVGFLGADYAGRAVFKVRLTGD